MKFIFEAGPVRLLERPDFKPGFVHGLASSACVVRIQLGPNIESVLSRAGEVLGAHLGEPEIQTLDNDCAFTRAARTIAYWYAEVQNRCGLIIQHNFWVGELTLLEGGLARFSLVLPCRFVKPSLATLAFVMNSMNKLRPGETKTVDIKSLIAELKNSIEKYLELGQNVPDLLSAAIIKSIPFHRIEGQTYQFGIGGAQRILQSTFTENTSVIGANLARNKIIAAKLLNQGGFPGGTPVRVENAGEAIKAVTKLGYPVVVKPIDADGGRGVSADLRTPEDLKNAFESAHRVSSNVMIDQHVAGTGHRFTIIFGKVVKVTAKMPWGVKGDGVSTIAELVNKQVSPQVRDGVSIAAPLIGTGLDDEALSLIRQISLEPDSVLTEGHFVALRRRNNAIAGGTTELLSLDNVHEDNLALARRVADLFMLDIAGIDLIIPDVSRSWLEQSCLICDVNAQPQIGTSTAADFLEAVMCGTGRIPVTLILTSNSQPTTLHESLRKLMRQLKIDGIASGEGIWINERQVGRAGMNGYNAAKALLAHRDVFNAAILMSVDDIHGFGLPSDRFQQLIIAGPVLQTTGVQVHVPDALARESVEQEIVQSGLVSARQEASSLIEKIWPHFIQEV